jgi:protein gp37
MIYTMAENSKIEWTDHTFNPWWGCVKVSPGCKNCYAETLSNRFGSWWGPQAERRFFGEKHWNEPLKWNRKAEKEGKRYRVFCGSMCDVFEIHDVPLTDEKISRARFRLWGIIENTPNLDWLLLTKRPENIADITPFIWQLKGWPDNVWVGTSVEYQDQADKRIPYLFRIPGRVRFLSVEPLLEAVDLKRVHNDNTYYDALGKSRFDYGHDFGVAAPMPRGIDWVIVGGESGPNKRPFNPDWARSIRDQCRAAHVPFFMKQIDKVQLIPDDLMIREFPGVN